ncbi:hypothetical protein V1290_002595 [Bradyrhizobium sp. AZCC 1578]
MTTSVGRASVSSVGSTGPSSIDLCLTFAASFSFTLPATATGRGNDDCGVRVVIIGSAGFE